MQVHRRNLVSEAEFLALPESMNKVELVDGEVVLAAAPPVMHQWVLNRLLFQLNLWASGRAVTVLPAPVDIRFGKDRILQPDAAVFLERIPLDQKGPLTRVPELTVEILSSDRVYDRVTKRLIYGAAGVKEYWVVEPSGPIERWTGPGLATSEEISDHLRSPLLEGFELPVRALFED